MTIQSIVFDTKRLLIVNKYLTHNSHIMPLTHALRTAAILLILSAVLQFFIFDQLLIKTVVVAHIIFLLSIFSKKHARRVSIISLGLAIVVPISAWLTYRSGNTALEFFVFNALVFLYVAYTAYIALKNS